MEVYNIIKTLKLQKNEFSVAEDELAEGEYWVMYADVEDGGDTIYLLHTETRCIKSVEVGGHLINLFSSGAMKRLFFLNIWPKIRVGRRHDTQLLGVTELAKLEFKDLHQWEIQNYPPFTFRRLVRKEKYQKEEEEDRASLFQCKEKLALFNKIHTPSPCLLQMTPNMVIYIVGPVLRFCQHSSYKENLMVVVEEEEDTHKVHTLHATGEIRELLNHVPSSEKDGAWRNRYHLMCSDYVIKMQLNERGEKTLDVMPLSKTPFYRKTLQNDIFV